MVLGIPVTPSIGATGVITSSARRISTPTNEDEGTLNRTMMREDGALPRSSWSGAMTGGLCST